MSDRGTDTFSWQRPGASWGSGTVTAPGLLPSATPPPPAPPESPQRNGPQRRRRQMLIFSGIAGAILAIGLTVILALALSSDGAPFRSRAEAPTDVRPPLAQACPAPTASP